MTDKFETVKKMKKYVVRSKYGDYVSDYDNEGSISSTGNINDAKIMDVVNKMY